MRSSVISRSRYIGSICDACKQQQQRRNLSVASLSRATATARDAPLSRMTTSPDGRNIATRQLARPITTTTRLLQSEANATAQSSSSDTNTNSAATPQTHYEFFPESLPSGPPPSGSFSIDIRALRREFLQLQSKAHPDLHPSHLKSRAEATSARINEAYRTLASPLARAQYLLSLQGRDVANDETAKVEDPELLMEVLEAREEIEEAESEAELEPLRVRNAEREAESVAELERCFAECDIEGAMRECVRLRYWVNIRESVDNWERGKPVVLEH